MADWLRDGLVVRLGAGADSFPWRFVTPVLAEALLLAAGGRAARWHATCADQRAEDSDRIGRDLLSARRPAEALPHLERALAAAVEEEALSDAVDLAEQVGVALDEAEVSDGDPRRAALLRDRIALALALGERAQASALVHASRDLVRIHRWDSLSVGLALMWARLAEHEDRLPDAQRELSDAVAGVAFASAAAAVCTEALARVELLLGHAEAALHRITRAEALSERDTAAHTRILCTRAEVLLRTGPASDARDAAEDALRAARATRSPHAAMALLRALAADARDTEELGRASELYAEAARLADPASIDVVSLRLEYAATALERGDGQAGLERAHAARVDARVDAQPRLGSLLHACLAAAAVQTGDPASALAQLLEVAALGTAPGVERVLAAAAARAERVGLHDVAREARSLVEALRTEEG